MTAYSHFTGFLFNTLPIIGPWLCHKSRQRSSPHTSLVKKTIKKNKTKQKSSHSVLCNCLAISTWIYVSSSTLNVFIFFVFYIHIECVYISYSSWVPSPLISSCPRGGNVRVPFTMAKRSMVAGEKLPVWSKISKDKHLSCYEILSVTSGRMK